MGSPLSPSATTPAGPPRQSVGGTSAASWSVAHWPQPLVESPFSSCASRFGDGPVTDERGIPSLSRPRPRRSRSTVMNGFFFFPTEAPRPVVVGVGEDETLVLDDLEIGRRGFGKLAPVGGPRNNDEIAQPPGRTSRLRRTGVLSRASGARNHPAGGGRDRSRRGTASRRGASMRAGQPPAFAIRAWGGRWLWSLDGLPGFAHALTQGRQADRRSDNTGREKIFNEVRALFLLRPRLGPQLRPAPSARALLGAAPGGADCSSPAGFPAASLAQASRACAAARSSSGVVLRFPRPWLRLPPRIYRSGCAPFPQAGRGHERGGIAELRPRP